MITEDLYSVYRVCGRIDYLESVFGEPGGFGPTVVISEYDLYFSVEVFQPLNLGILFEESQVSQVQNFVSRFNQPLPVESHELLHGFLCWEGWGGAGTELIYSRVIPVIIRR